VAGFYPDVPAPKMALDKDGTQWFGITPAGVVSTVPSANVATMTGAFNVNVPDSNTQYLPSSNTPGGKVAVVFPEARDLAALFTASSTLVDNYQSQHFVKVETSTNTTNGQDGTWTQLLAPYSPPMYAVPAYRTSILTAAATGIRGVRVVQTSLTNWGLQMSALHLYGTVSAGANPDRLAFWHPTLNQAAGGALFDWGDVPRNSSAVRTFRVKNLSGSKTAGGVRVALSSIQEANPTNIGAHAVSLDGSTYVAQIAPADLAPGAITPVLYLRRTTAATAQPGVWMLRAYAEATTWT